MPAPVSPLHARNDPAQYDDLVDSWWNLRGPFAMLHWIAEARAAFIPPREPGAVLLDVACGGGLLSPHLAGRGYHHVGVDLSATAVVVARARGVSTVRGDAARLPLGDGVAQVVVAGECLEHVPGLPRVVAEICRVLAPGGTLIIDTIAATPLARFVAVTLAERLPGGPPTGLHDPSTRPGIAGLIGIAGAAALITVGWAASRSPQSRAPFRAALAVAILDVGLLLIRGHAAVH